MPHDQEPFFVICYQYSAPLREASSRALTHDGESLIPVRGEVDNHVEGLPPHAPPRPAAEKPRAWQAMAGDT